MKHVTCLYCIDYTTPPTNDQCVENFVFKLYLRIFMIVY